MEIAHRQQGVLGALGELRAYLGPLLDPPVERRSKKRERPIAHLAMLLLEQPLGDVRPFPHPRLKCVGGFEDGAHRLLLADLRALTGRISIRRNPSKRNHWY